MAVQLTPQQKDILIRTALGEARGEGVEGMADVIQVIFNRAQSGQYPNDPAAVALQPYQFSTWNRGEGGNNPQQFKPSDPIYRKAEQALEMVASGERPDYTGGALFYHTPAVNPNWAGEVNKFGTIQRNGHIFYPSRPVPPGEIPNVVASQLDTQRPIPPLPQPRPAQRMMQGTGQPPTSAASRAVPTMNATPRLAPQGDGIFAYTASDMQPAQITPGMGSLTPDFFKTPTPPKRLPDIGSTSSPIGPGPTSLASVQDMYGRPQSRMDPIGAGPMSLASVQDMYGRPSGIGQPPATRSVPSVPVRLSQPGPMNNIGAMPSFADFQSQMGRSVPGPAFDPKDQARLTPGIYPMAPGGPAVASALSVTPPLPRPRPLRTLANVAMPTPMGQRPTLPTAPMQSPLRVTVQGANSYNAPQPQYVSTTGQPLTPRQTVRYNPDTNTFAPVTLYEPKRQERRPSLPSGPAQSLV